MNKKILITGGAGFIGSNLTADLLNNDGYEVICFDSLDAYYAIEQKEYNIKPFLGHKNYKFIKGDIRSLNDLDKIGNVDIIIHLAAKAGVRQSVEAPQLYYDVNLSGTINMLNWAKQQKVKQFVFASSSSVYGKNNYMPWSETQMVSPISPYAASKYSAEMIGHVYSHLHNIRFIALRFFSIYGMAQRPDLAINNFFDSILKSRPINIFGDGSSTRDYTFINDVTAAISAAINYDASMYEVINIGNNQSVKLLRLIKYIEDICGKKAIINKMAEQPGDVKHTCADISKASLLLNYKPSVELYNGLLNFYSWYTEHEKYKTVNDGVLNDN